MNESEQNRILPQALLDRAYVVAAGIYRTTVRLLSTRSITSENHQKIRAIAALVFTCDRVRGGLRDPASDKGGLAECHLAFGAHHADHIRTRGVGVWSVDRNDTDRCECFRAADIGIPHLSDLIPGHGTFIQVDAYEG